MCDNLDFVPIVQNGTASTMYLVQEKAIKTRGTRLLHVTKHGVRVYSVILVARPTCHGAL